MCRREVLLATQLCCAHAHAPPQAAAGRQHPWSGDATPYEDEDGLFSDEEPVAMPSNPVVPTGVSAAALPLCQQSLGAAFSVLDADRDGLINREDARRLVAFYIAQSVSSAENGPDVLAAPMPRPLTWDQHLVAGISATKALVCGRPGVALAAMEAFIAAKMAGGLQKHPLRTSDLVWAALGMGAAMLSLGAIAAAVTAWPVVGPWHQQARWRARSMLAWRCGVYCAPCSRTA